MISSGANKPKHQPVLSKSAQDRKDQLYGNLQARSVPNPVIDIVAGYDQKNDFVPYQIYKIKDADRFIIITKPKSDEADPVDVSKRIAVYDVTPTSIQLLAINDVREAFGIVTYHFMARPGEIKQIDRANKIVTISGVPCDERLGLEYLPTGGLQKLKSAVPQEILDHLSFLFYSQPESPDVRLVPAILRDGAVSIRHLINEKKINPNSVDENGVPMLVIAVEHGCYNAVQALVEGGADLESRSNASHSHRTALLHAIYHQRSSVAQFLVESGANVNAQDVRGNTSLFHATSVPLIEFLIKHDAHPCWTNLGDRRVVEETRYQGVISRLAEYHMNRDAEQRVEYWAYDEKSACYRLRFKDGLSTNDTLRAWKSIANKMQSQRAADDMGLFADDNIRCRMILQGGSCQITLEHYAQVRIPDAKHYAIQEVRGDQHGITITLKDEYKNDLLVTKKLRDIFAELKIKPAPDVKASRNLAAMFAPPGLTVNDKPVLPQYKKTR